MDDVKSILLSKTIWGAVLAVAGVIMGLFGLDTGALAGLDSEMVTLVGSGLAIYGRIKAVKKIGVVTKSDTVQE